MTTGGHALVGRAREVQVARALLDEVHVGRGCALLIGGEPGVGKTRFAEAVAEMARDSRIDVAWGRSSEDGGAPPFWPWIQALRSCLRGTDTHDISGRIGVGREHLLRLLPELGEADETKGDGDLSARFQLFEAVVQLLRLLSGERPLALLLEDIHAADEPSLRLLRFVAGSMVDLPMLLVVTYRDTEVAVGGVHGDVLGSLLREPVTHTIGLDGLDPDEVFELMASVADAAPSREAAQIVCDRTSGNPLLVTELVRLGASTSREAAATEALPVMTRQVIAQRVARLSPLTQRILAVASVVGRDFSKTVLSDVANIDRQELASALDEALAVRVIVPSSGQPHSYRFQHALVRDAVYLGVPTRKRQQLHFDVAETVARQHRDTLSEHLATVAHHHALSADVGDLATTVYYCKLAGERAITLLAFEEAARFFQLALRALDVNGHPDPAGHLHLVLAHGDALMRSGATAAAREAFLQATEVARRLDQSADFAGAVLGYGGRTAWTALRGDLNFRLLLEEALEQVGPTPSRLRARLLARLAGGPLRDDLNPLPRDDMSREALAMAGQVGDSADVVWSLISRWAAINRPDNAGDRLLIAGEIIELARETGMREAAVQGHHVAVVSHLELGNTSAARDESHALHSLAFELRESTARWLALSVGAALTLLAGDLAGAEQQAREAWATGRGAEPWNARVCFRRQLFFILRDQGRLAEIEPAIEESSRTLTFFAAMHVLLLAESGRRDQATALWERLRAGFGNLRRDEEFLFTLTMLADAVAILGDASGASELSDLLKPFADVVVLGHPDVVLGVVHGRLGVLAASLRRWDVAERHFAAAARTHERMEAPLLLARTLADHARGLHSQDPVRAQELTHRARQIAARHGALGILSRISRDRGRVDLEALQAATPPFRVPSEHAPGQGSFCLEGEYWSICYGGEMLRLRNSKGLRILACLLAHPEQPHPALDLERAGHPGDAAMVRALSAQNAGELLDDQARRAYRARLAEIRESIEEAEAWGDADQAGRLGEEREFIARELARGIGLGGRARQSGSIAERARLNVTRAVRTGIRRIANVDANLAVHLNEAVRTGAVCSYSPDPRQRIVWSVSPPVVHSR